MFNELNELNWMSVHENCVTLTAYRLHASVELIASQKHNTLVMRAASLHDAHVWSLMHSKPSAQGMSVQLRLHVMKTACGPVMYLYCFAPVRAAIIYFFTCLTNWIRGSYPFSPNSVVPLSTLIEANSCWRKWFDIVWVWITLWRKMVDCHVSFPDC